MRMFQLAWLLLGLGVVLCIAVVLIAVTIGTFARRGRIGRMAMLGTGLLFIAGFAAEMRHGVSAGIQVGSMGAVLGVLLSIAAWRLFPNFAIAPRGSLVSRNELGGLMCALGFWVLLFALVEPFVKWPMVDGVAFVVRMSPAQANTMRQGILVAGAALMAFGWIDSIRLLKRLERQSSMATPVDSAPREPVQSILLGIGDGLWQVGSRATSVYRGGNAVALLFLGDLLEARRRLGSQIIRRALWIMAMTLPLFAAWGAPATRSWRETRTTEVRTQGDTANDLRTGATWAPQRGPILVDVNGDGVADIAGMRWRSEDEATPLQVVVNDGKTLRPIWSSGRLAAQWASRNNQLIRTGDKLALLDSEGVLRVFAHATGALTLQTSIKPTSYACEVPYPSSGNRRDLSRRPGALFLDPDYEGVGVMVSEDGQKTTTTKPKGCRAPYEVPRCPADGVECSPVSSKWSPDAWWIRVVSGGGVALRHKVSDVKHPWALGSPILVGFDPVLDVKRFETDATFSSDPLHHEPRFQESIAGERVFFAYQLRSGKWHIGARSLKTGEVLWYKEPPRAEVGTTIETLTASATRVYASIDRRLEVFDAATGNSLGVLW